MVSVIMPTYNRAHFIRESILSVLEQSYESLELIICDDGSTDDTEQIVAGIEDPRVKYLSLPHTGLIGKVKNAGLRVSKGEYIAFIDSDDIWRKGKLAVQLELLSADSSAGFCITDITNFKDESILQHHCYSKHGTIETRNIFPAIIQNRFMVYTPTIVFRAECLDTMGYFDESFEWCADFQFNARLAYYFKAIVLYESFLLRRIHDTNRSVLSSIENYGGHVKTFEWLYNHQMIGKNSLRNARAHANKQIGHLFHRKGELTKARHYLLQSLRYKPWQVSVYWHWFKT